MVDVSYLYSDTPLQDVFLDQLDRDKFADRASQICAQVAEQADSSVIALIGPWGSGKTSLINFIRNALKKESTDWRFSEFNPWQFSDAEALLRSFFVTLAKELPGDKRRKLRTSLARHLKNISPAGKAAPLTGLDKALEAMSNVLRGDDSVDHTWDVIHKLLGKSESKLLVIIDDVDRLQPNELLTLLKLVRIVGRFPNVYYLIAYDEETLIDVLSTTDLAKGEKARAKAYLEKIVQVRLDLPPISYDIQSKFIEAHLNRSLKKLTQEISEPDMARLRKGLELVMRGRLSTPRSIRRLFAQVNAAFDSLQGEVNYVDFLMLTYLRTFESTLYHSLPKYRSDLVGTAGIAGKLSNYTEAKTTWRKRIESAAVPAESIDNMLAFLTELFTAIKSDIESSVYGGSWLKTLSFEQRVGSHEYFDRYFNFGLPESDVSDVLTIKALTQLVGGQTREKEVESLRKLVKQEPLASLQKIHAMLEHSEHVDPKPLFEFLIPVFRIHERDLRLIGSPPDVIHNIVISALHKTSLVAALRAYHALFVDDDALRLACRVAIVASRGLDEEEVPEWLRRYIQDLVPHLRSAILKLTEKPLDTVGNEEFLLIHWLDEIDTHSDVRQWMRSVTSENGNWDALEFLARLVPVRIFYSSSPVEKLGVIDPAHIDRMIGLDYALEVAEPYFTNAFPAPASFVDKDVTSNSRKAYMLSFLKHHHENSASEETEGDQ